MDFESMNSLLEYIKQTVRNELPIMGDRMVEIMNFELMNQTRYNNRQPTMYHRTGEFENMCQKQTFPDSVDGIFKDIGWTDLDGNDYFPLERWEEGGVFAPGYRSTGRTYPATNIVETSERRIDTEIPDYLCQSLRAKGLDVL